MMLLPYFCPEFSRWSALLVQMDCFCGDGIICDGTDQRVYIIMKRLQIVWFRQVAGKPRTRTTFRITPCGVTG